MDELDFKNDEYWAVRRDQTAYHEAAHAVVWWFLRKIDLKSVDIIPKISEGRLGQCETWPILRHPEIEAPNKQKQAVEMKVVMLLAGHCLDNQRDEKVDNWLDRLITECEDDGEHVDIKRAITAIEDFPDWPEQSTRSVLEYCAAWAKEVVCLPRAIAAIDALATELLKRDRVEGWEACRIIESAWGESSYPPMLNAGSVWRERFSEFCPKVIQTQP